MFLFSVIIKRKMSISKSPLCFQHTLGGGGQGQLRRVRGGGMRSASKVDAAPWSCSGHSAAVVLVVIYVLVIISARCIIYNESFWKKVL